MAIYDKASLVLIPSGTKTSKVYSQKPTNGDGDFTFSRSTAATRVNASGNIEKETQNLLLQSNSFNTTWQNVFTANVVGGQNGYDGTSDAWTLETQSGQASRIIQNTAGLGSVNSLSVYAKANTLDWIRLQISTATGNYVADFDLTNGVSGYTFGSPLPSIQSIGSGWYRVTISGFAPPTQVRIYAASGNNNLVGAGTIYIQDAQLEQGLVARDYIETTTTAIYGGITDNVPRLDYTDSSCPALLLEPQRTNVLPQSEYYGASGWDASAYPVTITSNSIISPDGNSNATLITPTSGNSRHAIREISISAVSGATYTLSVFFKKGGSRYVVFGDGGDTLWRLVTADLDNGVITDESNASGTITPFANGWYRITCQITRGNSGLIYFLIGASETDSNSTLPSFNNTSLTTYSWGAQVESNASYPTSYIPTYGSAVTRNADAASKTGVSSLIGQTEGTLFAELNWKGETGAEDMAIWMRFGITSYNEMIALYIGNNFKAQASVRSSAIQQVLLASDVLSDGIIKMAFAYKNNDFAFYVNGTLVGTDTNGSVPTCDQIYIGGYPDGGARRGKNKQTLVFKTRLTNEELADLTTL